ncbi:hypothetical protein B7494_g7549 [Chlorociboria aeruginascens]|nr:hypothetical protein B7494_g7549 [Chlorociboria aeruginascens]
MARQRKQKETKLKLSQPDRSAPDPSQETLLDLAQKRGILKTEQGNGNTSDAAINGDEPLIGRLGESILWSASLTMGHFTLDVLVTHQYAVEIIWRDIISRAMQAFPSIVSLSAPFLAY